MHKKIIFIVLWFFILNIFSIDAFYNNYSWKELYNKKEYSKSIDYFKKAWNKEWYYNIANSFYKEKKYKEAIKEYMSILWEEKNEINFDINHNIANSFYRIWGLEKDNTKKIKNWEESVKYYSNALNIKYDEQTKKNLEFVLNKIKQEKKKKEDKKNQEKKWDNKDESDKTNKWESEKKQDSKSWKESKEWESKQDSKWGSWEESDNKNWKGEESSKKQNWEKSWEENKDWNTWKNKESQWWENKEWQWWKKQEESNDLTSQQEQALKQYEESLKQEQNDNADSFNKVYKENTSNDPFANFFNDPFFNNNLLNWGSNEKDW